MYDQKLFILFLIHFCMDEPELRPDFVEKIKVIEKQKSIFVKDFAKKYLDV